MNKIAIRTGRTLFLTPGTQKLPHPNGTQGYHHIYICTYHNNQNHNHNHNHHHHHHHHHPAHQPSELLISAKCLKCSSRSSSSIRSRSVLSSSSARVISFRVFSRSKSALSCHGSLKDFMGISWDFIVMLMEFDRI